MQQYFFLFVTSGILPGYGLRARDALLFMSSTEVATRVKTSTDAHMVLIDTVKNVGVGQKLKYKTHT